MAALDGCTTPEDLSFCLPRFHDKVILEEELNSLREEQATAWERTKLHLQDARKLEQGSAESLTKSDTCTTNLNRGLSDRDVESICM